MQKKQAISLIVLVITIIVMIILAGSIILTLSNNGIIGKASEAVDKSDEANIKSIVQTYWAEAYTSGLRTKAELEDAVYNKIENSKLDVSEYGIAVTTNGVKVVKGWVQDELFVRKGVGEEGQKLNIGDYIDYDETVGGTVEVAKNVTWQILGASDNGELLIVSSETVGDHFIFAEYGTWLEQVESLDSYCEIYGKGKDATGARSINMEDLDRIFGQEKTLYGKGEIDEYGNVVTYSYDGSKIKYTSTNGLKGEFNVPSNGFHYYKGKDFVVADLSKGPCEITKITSDYYNFSLFDLSKTTEQVAAMLRKGRYWLATPCTRISENGFDYYINSTDASYIIDGSVGVDLGLVLESGLRPVVSLSPTVNLTGSSETGWSY